MKRIVLAITAVAIFAFASVTTAFADGRRMEDFGDHIGNYNFRVEISGITPDQTTIVGGFQSVSVNHANGAITLKRGYTATDDLWNWRKNIEDGIVDRRSGSIIILDQDLETEVARYNFYHAWPCKWYVPELDSDQSGMFVEEIELAVEKLERG